ncbi:MAG: hypothetical protein IJ137_05435 [Eubacterium sp.]|nr:hypothetical protein [Eubacterium sp.]
MFGIIVSDYYKRFPKPLYFLNLLTAIVWVMGIAFHYDNTLNLLHATAAQKLKCIVYVLGSVYVLNLVGLMFHHLIHTESDSSSERESKPSLFNRHPYLVPFAGLIIIWSPQVILSYPGAVCPDAWDQIAMFFGYQPFTAHHPSVHTWLTGTLIQSGIKLGNANLGLYFSVLLQMIIFAAVLAYLFLLFNELKTPRWLRLISFIIAAISPYYTSYIGVITKDNIYSYGILLFTLELVYISLMKEDYWRSPGHYILYVLSVLLSILFRNNGVYVIYPVTVVLLIIMMFAVARKRISRTQFSRIILGLLLPILLANGIQGGLNHYYHIKPTSIKDALSFPFQQTARYAKEYGDQTPEEEKETIDKVLNYDLLARKYNPRISDPVKAIYRPDASSSDLMEYIKVWLRQGIRHPMVYFKATMNQNYYLLSPLVANDTMYDQTVYQGRKKARVLSERYHIHDVAVIQRIDVLRTIVNKTILSLPVTGILFSLAFCNILLLYLLLLAIKHKLGKFILLSLPALLSDAIIVLAPVIKGHPRYGFPIIYTIPLLISWYIYLYRGKQAR